MKKKLEAELISIAHRILKLKNRSELDQLQQETLRLYEKLSVLRFVEDNFGEVKPSISYASAEETLEEIYGIEELPPVKANEQEAEEEKKREEQKKQKGAAKKDKEDKSKEGDEDGGDDEEAPVSEKEKEITREETDEEVVEEPAEEENNEAVEEETGEDSREEIEEEEPAADEDAEENEDTDEEGLSVRESKAEGNEDAEAAAEEPGTKVEVTKPEEEIKAMEAAAEAVYNKEMESTSEEEDKAVDAEMITLQPDKDAKVEDSGLHFDFAFERKPAPDEPKKEQKELTFEDFHDYKEPEFVKKDTDAAKAEDMPAADDWRNWEPKGDTQAKEEPKAETKKEEPKQENKKSLNDALGKTISLGLNDRIAFEKHLFGGSGEDLNRVLSQLNTFDTFREAREFIDDLVKPDYNNWKDKEEYEERFMGLVEKRFD